MQDSDLSDDPDAKERKGKNAYNVPKAMGLTDPDGVGEMFDPNV